MNKKNLTIKKLQKIAHQIAKEKGFWDNDRNNGELIALIHSELSEALEGLRKNLKSDHIKEFLMVEEELADAMIRIADMAEARGYRLEQAIKAKLKYNKKRPYRHDKKF